MSRASAFGVLRTNLWARVRLSRIVRCREQVEALEDHADLTAHGAEIFQIIAQFDAVDDDPALVMLFQPVDAADHRGLAGPRGAADHNPFAL